MSLSESARDQCDVTWPGDPDIAGLGVLVGFTVFTWATVSIYLVVAVYEVLEWLRSPRPSVGDFFLNKQPTGLAGKRPAAKLHRVCLELRGTLCDVQIVTGTGILVAAFVQWHTISFYHEQVALICWFQTLNSLWGARDASADAKDEADRQFEWWEYYQHAVRCLTVFASCTLSTVFQAMAILREEREWHRLVPGRCYVYHPDYFFNDWFWCVTTAVLAGYMFLAMLPWPNPADQALRKYVTLPIERLAEKTGDARRTLEAKYPGGGSSWRKLLGWVWEAMVFVSLLLFTTVVWLILQILMILTVGDTFRPLEAVFQIVFAAQNTSLLFVHRNLNKAMLEPSEDKWGFGQVLPVALLLTIVINYIDAHSRVVQEETKNSQRP